MRKTLLSVALLHVIDWWSLIPSVCGRLEMCKDQLKGVHQAITGTISKRRSNRGSSGAAWEDPGRNFQDAMSWIAQQKVSTHQI